MAIEITSFKKYSKGSLVGFFDCKLSSIGLLIKDLTFHKDRDKEWVGLPGCSYEENGQTKWANIPHFDKTMWSKLQKACLKTLGTYLAEKKNIEEMGDIPF